jgi:hypothetical protein
MPFMQRITWSGVALHEGVLPGYPASHGCIRLTHKFASELWGMTRMGVRVVVTPDDGHPVKIAHPNLPVPTMTPAPASVTDAGAIKPSLVAMADARTAQGSSSSLPAAAKLLSPLDRLKAVQAKMVADGPAMAKAARQAGEVSAAKAAEANQAIRAVRNAELALAAATSQRAAAAKAVEDAKTTEAVDKAKSALASAEARFGEASTTLASAAASEAEKTSEALAAATAAWDAEKASDAAVAIMRAGERATEPISVFVSRKTGRVYIRQAWKAIHEAQATFKDPNAPLGTHIYVAVADADNAMEWLAMTYPQTTSGPDSHPPPQRYDARRRGRPEPRSAAAGHPLGTAADALDRIVLTDETKAFIADRLWVGASIIVSDYPLSPSSPVGTEFIVQPR